MTFDELQKNWQHHESGYHVSIDSEMLLKEVKRNKESFKATIFWRDVREIGVAIPLFIYFLYVGLKEYEWPLLLIALGVLFVAVFMIVDRISQRRKQPKRDETLMGCIESSQAEIEHQIWLLKNVFWWYLLPPVIGMVVSISGVVLSIIRGFSGKWSMLALVVVLGCSAVAAFILRGVYLLNQKAVCKELVPRREELEGLAGSLKNGD